MGLFKVRPGHAFAHNGATLTSGAIVELPDRLAYEVRDHIDPCDEAGELQIPVGGADLVDLSHVQAHERVSLLEAAVATKRRELAFAEAQLAQELAAGQTADAPDDAPEEAPETKPRRALRPPPPSPVTATTPTPLGLATAVPTTPSDQ